MTVTLGLNISSLRSQRQLSRTSGELSSVFERLSSGQRINRASDDAAGLAIADSLNADSRVYTQGVRNLNDGISVLNIADGALQELTNITVRLTELAEQAANGTLGSQQRAALDEEAQALKSEYFRIAKTTEFNGRKIFEGDYGELRLQAGYGAEASIGSGLGGSIGDGTFDSSEIPVIGAGPSVGVAIGDINGDGNLDIVSTDIIFANVNVFLGNGTGGFTQGNAYSVGATPRDIELRDFDNDGILDIAAISQGATAVELLLGNGDGSFGASTQYSIGSTPLELVVDDFNGDGFMDVATADSGSAAISILLGNGDGTLGAASQVVAGGNHTSLESGDFNNDGIRDLAVANSGTDTVSVLIGSGNGTFAAAVSYSVGQDPNSVVVGDFNGDGITDLVTVDSTDGAISLLTGSGDGTFSAGAQVTNVASPANKATASDFNGDGHLDLAVSNLGSPHILLNDGSGTFEVYEPTFASGTIMGVRAGDFDNDGVVDLVSTRLSTNRLVISLGNSENGVAPLLSFSLKTMADAKQALSQFTQKTDQLSQQRGQIGAFQSRIEVARNVLGVSAENFKSAESRIRDADIAIESAELTRLQILQNAAAAVLGQANQQPALVLQLLSQG